MQLLNIAVSFFQEGGIFMYPIVLVLAIGLTIAIERYLHLSAASYANQKVWRLSMDALSRRDFKQALGISQQSNTAIGRILAYGLERSKSAGRRDDIETAMEEGLMEALPRLERRTHYLAIFANISTLLGLLGTEGSIIDFDMITPNLVLVKAIVLFGLRHEF